MAGLANTSIEYVFWDWDGTLCLQQYFWPESRLKNKEIVKLAKVWEQPDTHEDWMRGKISLDDLVERFGCKLSAEELTQLLAVEWHDRTTINKPLFSAIKRLFPNAKHVLVTVNMDVFNEYTKTSEFLKNNMSAVFNSADYGVTKTDSPSLFEIVRQELGLVDFSSTLLIDDSKPVCQVFRKLGGNTINVTRNERT